MIHTERTLIDRNHILDEFLNLAWNWTMLKIAVLAMLIPSTLALSLSHGRAATDFQIIDGFNKTVFGSEYSPRGIQTQYIRKFNKTVRFKIHNMAAINRRYKVRKFIGDLNRKIRGIQAVVTSSSNKANFNVYVVDRKDYVKTLRKKVFKRDNAATPGKCFVRSVFTFSGIIRSDAVIVSDEGENLFRRCLAEEILQGLGPLNEHPSLKESMFNDTSKHLNFTRFDRYILNMLYDPRVKPGKSKASIQPLLPILLRDAKQRF